MQNYFTTMHSLGVRVSGLLSAGLGLDASFFEGCTSEMAHALRLLHYSAEVREAVLACTILLLWIPRFFSAQLR